MSKRVKIKSGADIRRLRIKLGVEISDIAATISQSQSRVKNIEARPDFRIMTPLLQKVCKYLGAEPVLFDPTHEKDLAVIEYKPHPTMPNRWYLKDSFGEWVLSTRGRKRVKHLFESAVSRPKAETYNGQKCKKCGNKKRYTTTKACCFCFIRSLKKKNRPTIRSKQ